MRWEPGVACDLTLRHMRTRKAPGMVAGGFFHARHGSCNREAPSPCNAKAQMMSIELNLDNKSRKDAEENG